MVTAQVNWDELTSAVPVSGAGCRRGGFAPCDLSDRGEEETRAQITGGL